MKRLWILGIIILMGLLIVAGCANVGTAPSQRTVTLYYTGVGEEGIVGCAPSRQLRYGTDSTRLANDTTYGTLLTILNSPPACAGQPDSMIAQFNGNSETDYFFIMRSYNAKYYALWSNVTKRRFPLAAPPAKVSDLR